MKSREELTERRDYMRIRPIDNGLVIDHLVPGTGLFILNLLDYTDRRVTPGLNYDSKKVPGGKKDIIFMEGGGLSDDEKGAIAIISPCATINYIRDGKLDEACKLHPLPVPGELGDILLCPNIKCTTNTEGGKRRFRLVEVPGEAENLQERLKVHCTYCERDFFGPLVKFYTGQTLRDIRKGRFYFKR